MTIKGLKLTENIPYIVPGGAGFLIDLEKETLENYIGIISDKSHIKDKWVFRGYKIYMYTVKSR